MSVCWIASMTLLLPLTAVAGAQMPPTLSIRAALDLGIAAAKEGAPSVRCTREHEKLAFRCVEQLDRDHFTAVDVVAEPIAPEERRRGGGSVQLSDPVFGPGGGGGRYSVTTTDGAYAINVSELQRLMVGSRPRLPSATRLLGVITTAYDGKSGIR